MKPIAIIFTLVSAFAVGFLAASFFAAQRARVAVLAGPYSDNFRPARSEIAQAVAKLRAGDTNVIEHLTAADSQIERAEQWSKHFVGLKDGDARQ